ncbi:DUF916 domain-containing protein [Asanoa sp. WMMD1127]|uniref:WxL protein peptidoglycan domain-containing protein n=1 Tax=Asanoa sp. WMMD1127 TaxID=3016107 RepID=UPI0024159EF2|nr:DUF916 domain-containing protein [Asanoa sp. WMMD1127]MDG4820507.1 DUF916 domain-containing protein [Asanoa sp. WMMD1127]
MRLLAVAVVAALTGVLPVGAAAHAEPTTPQTWGIAPSTRNGPDGRASFTYKLDPGATLTDYAAISNYSAAPITLDLYASDAFTTEQGGFDLLPAAREPTDVGSWVSFDSRFARLTIPSKSRMDVPFRLSVPKNATPGDHAGGIVAAVASTAVSADGGQVKVDRRVGARMYLRVTGEVRPAVDIERVAVSYTGTVNPMGGGVVTATYRIRNTGNVRLTGRPTTTVAGPFGVGRRVARTDPVPEILPGGEVLTTVRANGILPLGRLTVHFDLLPTTVGPPGAAPPAVTNTASLWAPPWPQIAVSLLVAGLGWLGWWRRRASRRALAAARDAGRAEALSTTSIGGKNS